MRGDAPQLIQTRAGHSDYSTTLRYIRAAEAVRDGFGEVFPALPEMAKQSDRPKDWPKFKNWVPNYMILQRGGRDSKSHPANDQEPISSANDAISGEDVPSPITGGCLGSPVVTGNTLTDAEIEAAIDRLTRALASAADETIVELVAERKSLRVELEERRRAAAGNVIVIDARRRK